MLEMAADYPSRCPLPLILALVTALVVASEVQYALKLTSERGDSDHAAAGPFVNSRDLSVI